MPRGRRPGPGGEQTRARVLAAAAVVFARMGYHRAGMEDVMAAAGLSKGGLYFHFPGKEPLFMAVLDRLGSLLIQPSEADAAPPERVRGYLARLAAAPDLAWIWRVEAAAAFPAARQWVATTARQVREMVCAPTSADPSGQAAAAELCLAAAHSALDAWLLGIGGHPLATFDRLAAALPETGLAASRRLARDRHRPALRLRPSGGSAAGAAFRGPVPATQPILHWPTW